MSTAERQKPIRFKPVRLPAAFKGVSFGDRVASIGVNVNLEDVEDDSDESVKSLFRWLCTRHIKAQLILGRRNEGETQGKLVATDFEVHSEFDTGRLSVSTQNVSFKLSAAIDQVNCEEFRKFANRQGWLKILSVAEAIDTGDEEDKDKEADDE